MALIADGTACDKNKHCINGECVIKDMQPVPIDGGWSSYNSWTACSRTCDGGVQFSTRSCNNPKPSFGGKFCTGPKERIRSCNIDRCPEPSNPRLEICKRYNLTAYIPRINEDYPCNLFCPGKKSYQDFNLDLPDGTPCNPHETDICVKGKCYKLGCDKLVGSLKTYDNCNVCNGRNDTCVIKQHYYDGSSISSDSVNYVEAFIIPANSTNIYIKKVSQRRTPYTNEYYDDFILLLYVDYKVRLRSAVVEKFNGGQLYYSGTHLRTETVKIIGKINREINVNIKLINYRSYLNFPKIEYHYFEANNQNKAKDKYIWKFSETSSQFCNNFCKGIHKSEPNCIREKDDIRMDDSYCNFDEKPKAVIKNCSSICGYRWERPNNDYIITYADIHCPKNCKFGKIQILYFCKMKDHSSNRIEKWKTVSYKRCSEVGLGDHQKIYISCIKYCKRLIWVYENWNKCEGKCLYGTQYRNASCMDLSANRKYPDSYCNLKFKHRTVRQCLLSELCGHWKVGEWSKCPVSCGFGIKSRSVTCHHYNGTVSSDSSVCLNEAPVSQTPCENVDCTSTSFWRIMKKSQCYAKNCVPGVFKADIRCVDKNLNILPNEMCGEIKYPKYFRGCMKEQCNQYFWKVHSWDNFPCYNDSCKLKSQTRKVECTDSIGEVHNNSFCGQFAKPTDSKFCIFQKHCSNLPTSCKEIKDMDPNSKDGEYNLTLGLKGKYEIYCADMDTSEPKEYISLQKSNYARSSKLLKLNANPACTFEEENDNFYKKSDYVVDEFLFAKTMYTKIRLKLSDLSVDIMDGRFSTTIGNSFTPYGTAKDCSGSLNCPKGFFNIDLRGTYFSVSTRTKWNEMYYNHGFKLMINDNSQTVKGWCGGACTGCFPLKKLFLETQVN